MKKGIVEFKLRREQEREDVPVGEALERVVAAVEALYQELEDRVVEVEYTQ